MNTIKHEVVFEPFTERHFVRTFQKKYRGAWETTRAFLMQEFAFVGTLFQKSIAETIVDAGDIKICKTEFKIAGTNQSRHGSGNRCIIAIHRKIARVCVLLVYHKNDLGGSNETARWKALVKENYPEYAEML